MSSKRARIADSNPFTATDGVLAGYEQANKSASQQVDQSTSHQTEKSTSQEVSQRPDQSNSLLSAPAIVAQPRSSIEDDGSLGDSTSQQVNKLTSEEVELLTSEQVDLLELEERSTQQPSQSVQPRSQQADKLTSQPVNQPILKKATYQIDAVVLEALDRYQLQLQIDLGRRNAPHKETIVEEAIVQWLERTAKSPDRAVKSLVKRQELR